MYKEMNFLKEVSNCNWRIWNIYDICSVKLAMCRLSHIEVWYILESVMGTYQYTNLKRPTICYNFVSKCFKGGKLNSAIINHVGRQSNEKILKTDDNSIFDCLIVEIETLVIRENIRAATQMGMSNLIIESDSKVSIQSIIG